MTGDAEMEPLARYFGGTIGIIGAGHLGMRLAVTLVAEGFPRERLLLSHAGNPATRVILREAGLEGSIAENEEICRKSSLIFITVRPQSAATLDGLPFPRGALVVSCMAGVPAGVLERRWGVRIVRMMPSGPDTIRQGQGIAAIFPKSDLLAGLLTGMGLRVQVMPDEEAIHVFTVGICLPAAILASRAMGHEPDDEVHDAVRECPMLSPLYAWAKEVLPEFTSAADREAYIAKMSTAGGITEAIVRNIRSGVTFSRAIKAGIDRSREISREAEATLRAG